MKKTTTLLLVAMIALCSQLSAQSMLDSTIAGYENIDTNFKKAFGANLWYGNYSDSAFFVTDAKAFAGNYSLCFQDTLSTLRKVDGTIDSKKAVYFSFLPMSSDTLFAGSYTLSQKIYLAEGNTMTNFFTEIGSPVAASINWDISSSPRGEWITLEDDISITEDLDISFTNSKNTLDGSLARLITRIPADVNNNDLQIMYIDDHQMSLNENVTPSVTDTIAGNYLDTYFYGFEVGTTTDIEGIFVPATSLDYVTYTTEKNTLSEGNKFALKFDVPSLTTLAKNAKGKTNNFSIQMGSKEALNGVGSASVPAGVYTASINIYLEERNITGFTTPFNTNAATTTQDEWFNIVWEIPTDIALGEWVTLEQKLTLAMDYDTKVTIKTDQKDLIDTALNAVFYLDDYAFVDFVEDTITTPTDVYKVGNIFDEAFFGFEKSAETADGWYPQKNNGAGYYSFPTDVKASGEYSMLLNVPTGDAAVPAKLKLQAVMAEGNFSTQGAGVYDLYMKVFIGENSTIKSMNTNFSTNKDADKNIIPSPFKAIVWDLTEVKKGEWVELHKIDTLPAFDRAKYTIQIASDSLDYSTNDMMLYIDNIAAVFNKDYIFVPKVMIGNPVEDSVFTTTDANLNYKVYDFYLGTDGKVKYTVDSETPVIQDKAAPIVLTDLSEGAHKVVVELVDMDGASLNPVASDMVNFSVQLSAALRNHNSIETSVYPNPAQEQISIQAEAGSQITIYNLLGTQVKSASQTSDITALNISKLKAGTYFVQIQNNKGQAVTKLQVK